MTTRVLSNPKVFVSMDLKSQRGYNVLYRYKYIYR